MRTRVRLLTGAILVVVVVLGVPALAGDDASTSKLVAGNTAFGCDLYAKLRAGEGNVFLSPYSISTALAMTWGGARGVTELQMADALRFPLPQAQLHLAFAALQAGLDEAQAGGDVALSVANSLWPQKGEPLRDDYLALVKRNYGVTITPVDYRRAAEPARLSINAWVAQKTRDKILDLVPPGLLTDMTRLVLVNAIYFKGSWQEKFEVRATRAEPFHVSVQESVQTRMMNQVETFAYADLDSLQALALPYRGGRLSMLVLLPKERDGLARLESGLTAEALARWRAALAQDLVQVSLPRFKLTCEFSLGETLQALGMVDAFDGARADFSGMNGARDLFMSAILHKAFVDVTEEGTEAAAATAVILMKLSEITAARPPATFRADHPFLFLIQDDATGSVLFLGRVTDPTTGGS